MHLRADPTERSANVSQNKIAVLVIAKTKQIANYAKAKNEESQLRRFLSVLINQNAAQPAETGEKKQKQTVDGHPAHVEKIAGSNDEQKALRAL